MGALRLTAVVLTASNLAVQEEVPRPPEPLDSYVMVEKSDVLEAIGVFVAAYLASMPEAQDLQPKQLQAALTQTFKVRACAPAVLYIPRHAAVHYGSWPRVIVCWYQNPTLVGMKTRDLLARSSGLMY